MDTLTDLLNQIQKAPVSLLVIVALNLIGLVLKLVPRFPNGWIPLCLLILGAGAMVGVGDVSSVGPGVRFPEITLAIIGIIYGFVAWLLHATLLKRLEKFVPAGLIELPSELTGPPAEPPPKPPPSA
jgi:hypothetical protein